MLTEIFIYAVLLIAGLILWKKTSDSEYFWLQIPVGGALMVSVAQYFNEKYLLYGNQDTLDYPLLITKTALWLVFILIVVLHIFRSKPSK